MRSGERKLGLFSRRLRILSNFFFTLYSFSTDFQLKFPCREFVTFFLSSLLIFLRTVNQCKLDSLSAKQRMLYYTRVSFRASLLHRIEYLLPSHKFLMCHDFSTKQQRVGKDVIEKRMDSTRLFVGASAQASAHCRHWHIGEGKCPVAVGKISLSTSS